MVASVSATDADLLARARAAVERVCDPEIPVLTIVDLGVLRAIDPRDDDGVNVTITPTYSGCPAMAHIESEIVAALDDVGIAGTVVTSYSPAWSTNDITPAGAAKLAAYGIAPPHHAPPPETGVSISARNPQRAAVSCPQCGSEDTKLLSEFGSTACKALYQCQSCAEPFDYFKEL